MRQILGLTATLSLCCSLEYLGCTTSTEQYLITVFFLCKVWEMFAVDLNAVSALDPLLMTL